MTLTDQQIATQGVSDRRGNWIGGSEAYDAIRHCPHLWRVKKGLEPADPENVHMIRGKILEPIVMQLYEHRTGRKVVERAREVSLGYPWMVARPDGGIESDPSTIIEGKTANDHAARYFGSDGSDVVPHRYRAQGLHQGIATGARRIEYPVLLGDSSIVAGLLHHAGAIDFERMCEMVDFRIFRIDMEECADQVELVIERQRQFVDFLERDEVPPPVDADDAKARWPEPISKKATLVTPEIRSVLVEWQRQKEKSSLAKKRAKELEDAIRAHVGDSENLLDTDGQTALISAKKRVVKEHTVKESTSRPLLSLKGLKELADADDHVPPESMIL